MNPSGLLLANDAQTQKPRPSRFRPPALAVAVIVVAVALVAGGVFAVLEAGGIRHLLHWPVGGQTPTRATTSVAAPSDPYGTCPRSAARLP